MKREGLDTAGFGAAGWVLYALLRAASYLFWIARRVRGAFGGLESEIAGDPGSGRSLPRYWQNSLGNQFSVPFDLEHPRSVDEVVEIVRLARRQGRAVRAVGSGHSFSDVAATDDYLLDMHGLKADVPVDPALLRRGVDASSLYGVESGVTIRELNRRLFAAKLALVNMGSYDIQTISGAISTGTHGSGVGLGPLSDAVRAVVLVHGDGDVWRIEPTGGVTDPAAYAERHPEGPRLVQDDDLFYSVVVSMGCLGVVTSYVLEVRPAFRLRETRTLKDWNDVRRDLADGVLDRVAHYDLYVNPYPVRGTYWCIVTIRTEVDSSEGAAGVDAGSRNPISTLLTHFRFVDGILRWALSSARSFTPYFLLASLRGLADKEYVDESFRVFNLGDVNLVPAFSSELHLDAGGDPLAPKGYLAAIERMLEIALEQARVGPGGHWHTSPLGIRFVKASPHHLAPEYGRRTCTIEIPFLLGTRGAWDLLRYYERQFLPWGARPHWGQATFALSAETTMAAFERWPAFVRAFSLLNPHGTFDNAFTRRLSLGATRGGR